MGHDPVDAVVGPVFTQVDALAGLFERSGDEPEFGVRNDRFDAVFVLAFEFLPFMFRHGAYLGEVGGRFDHFVSVFIVTKQFDRQIAEIENTEWDSQEKTDTIEELERLKAIDHQQNSYIGRIGQTIQPILAPLGFDWKMSVSLLTGMAAKEVVVSTLSVLYTGNADDDSQALSERLKQDRNAEGNLVFTPLIAISLMLFVLIYFPCIATISAIVNESGSWKWGIFVIIYTCVLAWIVSFIVYQTGNFFVGLFC